MTLLHCIYFNKILQTMSVSTCWCLRPTSAESALINWQGQYITGWPQFGL